MIGTADSEDGEINDIFARVLLCREKITNFAISFGVNKKDVERSGQCQKKGLTSCQPLNL